ncbi:hypothetical protein [Gorillibacterium massiliense]|uniref:hypothetical protein n=1 Tax=Gorillibacterium massiliense TaxID=1280390 RepID=UPI0004B1C68A|nr:hypothetical protein [Gorillibacterium massiliense]
MNELKPDWYNLMKTSITKKDGFTLGIMQRVEVRTSGKSGMRKRLKYRPLTLWFGCATAAVLVLAILFWLGRDWKMEGWSGLYSRVPAEAVTTVHQTPDKVQQEEAYPSVVPSTGPGGTDTQRPMTTLAPPAQDGLFGVKSGQSYRVSEFHILQNMPIEANSMLSFQVWPGETYTIGRLSGIYAELLDNGNFGWLPAWYLTSEAAKVKKVVPYTMLVPKTIKLYPYPGAVLYPYSAELSEGRVVEVREIYENWCKIAVFTFNEVEPADFWVRKSDLAEYEPERAKDGRIRRDAIIFDEKGAKIEHGGFHSSYPYVMKSGETIISKHGQLLEVSGLYNTKMYVKPEDFLPNPFAEEVDPAINGGRLALDPPTSSGEKIKLELPDGWQWKNEQAVEDEKVADQYGIYNSYGDRLGTLLRTAEATYDSSAREGATILQSLPASTTLGKGDLHVMESPVDRVYATEQHPVQQKIYARLSMKKNNESWYLYLQPLPGEQVADYLPVIKKLLGLK